MMNRKKRKKRRRKRRRRRRRKKREKREEGLGCFLMTPNLETWCNNS